MPVGVEFKSVYVVPDDEMLIALLLTQKVLKSVKDNEYVPLEPSTTVFEHKVPPIPIS
jgi:hypothetical protein